MQSLRLFLAVLVLSHVISATRPIGIRNNGQTCYMNSVIQLIACIDPVVAEIIHPTRSSPHFIEQFTYSRVLYYLFIDLHPPQPSLHQFVSGINAADFLLAFECTPFSGDLCQQGPLLHTPHDAAEFAIAFLRSLEWIGIGPIVHKTMSFALAGSPFGPVSLMHISNADGCRSVGECIHQSFPIHYDGLSKVTSTPPPYLLITLDRIDLNGNKNHYPVAFDSEIRLDGRVFQCLLDYPGVAVIYNRIGVIIHRGDADGGHYFTYKHDGQTWWMIDDSQVEQRHPDHSDETARAAVIFLYHRE